MTIIFKIFPRSCNDKIIFSQIDAECYPRDTISFSFNYRVKNEDGKDQFLTLSIYLDTVKIEDKYIIVENSTDDEILYVVRFQNETVSNFFNLTLQFIPLAHKNHKLLLSNFEVNFTRKCPAFSAQENNSTLRRCRCLRNYWENQTSLINGHCCNEPDICFECHKCWDNLCDHCYDSKNGSCVKNECNTKMEKNIEWVDGLCVCKRGYYRTNNDTCEPCHDTCYECFNSSLPCTTCWPLAVVNYQMENMPKGICFCPDYLWTEQYNAKQPSQVYKCRKCYYRCPGCSNSYFEEEEKCDFCIPPLKFDRNSKICMLPPGNQ
jgi:hypothetical protein